MLTALVTGVSRGLGLCITQALKRSGYRVLGVGLSQLPENSALDDYERVDFLTRIQPCAFSW
jgi:NAD(P)-dependent dehydrogenase (short-subunit alcohol dehydrogenase family)